MWNTIERLDDTTQHQYMTDGEYGVMGNDETGWSVAHAADGVEVDATQLDRSENRFDSAAQARVAAELLNLAEAASEECARA